MTTIVLGGYQHVAGWDVSFYAMRRYLTALTLLGWLFFLYDCSWCWWCLECLIF